MKRTIFFLFCVAVFAFMAASCTSTKTCPAYRTYVEVVPSNE